MLVPTLLLSFLCLSLSDPGAPWTEEESLIVKGKIYALMDKSVRKTKEYLDLHKKEIGLKDWPERTWMELVAVMGVSTIMVSMAKKMIMFNILSIKVWVLRIDTIVHNLMT